MGGSGSTTYTNAFAFFKLRELNGVKINKKKKKTEGADSDTSATNTNFDGIVLGGDEDNEVP